MTFTLRAEGGGEIRNGESCALGKGSICVTGGGGGGIRGAGQVLQQLCLGRQLRRKYEMVLLLG